jgi:hypothetical protein
LCFRVPNTFNEEIGIATEVFGGRDRNRINSVLKHDMTDFGKTGDPMSKRSDEITQLVCG